MPVSIHIFLHWLSVSIFLIHCLIDHELTLETASANSPIDILKTGHWRAARLFCFHFPSAHTFAHILAHCYGRMQRGCRNVRVEFALTCIRVFRITHFSFTHALRLWNFGSLRSTIFFSFVFVFSFLLLSVYHKEKAEFMAQRMQYTSGLSLRPTCI